MNLTYHDLLANPDRLNAFLAEARRERSRAVYRYLIAPIARIFERNGTLEYTRPLRSRTTQRTAYC